MGVLPFSKAYRIAPIHIFIRYKCTATVFRRGQKTFIPSRTVSCIINDMLAMFCWYSLYLLFHIQYCFGLELIFTDNRSCKEYWDTETRNRWAEIGKGSIYKKNIVLVWLQFHFVHIWKWLVSLIVVRPVKPKVVRSVLAHINFCCYAMTQTLRSVNFFLPWAQTRLTNILHASDCFVFHQPLLHYFRHTYTFSQIFITSSFL
jgi:hypothetical protein